jgi:hypothetical protein
MCQTDRAGLSVSHGTRRDYVGADHDLHRLVDGNINSLEGKCDISNLRDRAFEML